jgi:hypothetical protein
VEIDSDSWSCTKGQFPWGVWAAFSAPLPLPQGWAVTSLGQRRGVTPSHAPGFHCWCFGIYLYLLLHEGRGLGLLGHLENPPRESPTDACTLHVISSRAVPLPCKAT